MDKLSLFSGLGGVGRRQCSKLMLYDTKTSEKPEIVFLNYLDIKDVAFEFDKKHTEGKTNE